jgi:putative ATPase
MRLMARRARGPDRATPSLFDAARRRDPSADGAMPLAERVRPDTLADVVGHGDLLGDGKPLSEAIEADRLPSMVLWGPPGSGKTTVARVVAGTTLARFVPFSAVLGGVADIRRIVAEAADRRSLDGGATVLFVDEIHRFNKSQQDAFLPHVEDGTVTLIGATTENPSFSLNAPLLSRCMVYRLESLSRDDLMQVLRRAMAHPRGFTDPPPVDDEALEAVADGAGGDARRALTTLDLVVAQAMKRGAASVTAEWVAALRTHSTLLYDKAGDEHYDVVSALIKSLRGSDPDAAVYWMMRMVEAGDDPLFVLRRMIIFASEDIGNADPRALSVAVDADRAFRRLGMPEGIYPMAQAVLYLASAPKSNAANLAWHRAKQAIAERGALPVPHKLRNAPTKLMGDLGHGAGYRYPHHEDGYAAGETYLPDQLVGARFYEPTDRGLEAKIAAWLRKLRGQDEGDEP